MFVIIVDDAESEKSQSFQITRIVFVMQVWETAKKYKICKMTKFIGIWNDTNAKFTKFW